MQHSPVAYAWPTLPVQVPWKCNLDYSIVVWVHQGTAQIHLEDEVIELQRGQALWIPRRRAHMVEHAADSLAVAILIPARHTRRAGDALRRIEVPPGHTGWMFYFMLLTLSPLHRGQVPIARIVDHVEHFLVDRFRVPATLAPAVQRPALARVQTLLGQDPTRTLDELAALVGLSPRTLRRHLSAAYGVGYREVRRQIAVGNPPAGDGGRWRPVPALSTRWMRFPHQRYAVWAYQGRGTISLAEPGEAGTRVHSQRMEAGELLIIPDGFSVRLAIDSGALFFPLSMPLPPEDHRTALRLPLRVPAQYEPLLLREAIAHITALRPPHFERRAVFRLLETLGGFPGLRWPERDDLSAIAQQLTRDLAARGQLADLAATHGMSLRQLQRAWRDAAGDSPAGWWRAYRLQRAEGMLAAGLPLAFVARCVGYEHVSNFSRALHRARGLRPGAVRPHPDSGQQNII